MRVVFPSRAIGLLMAIGFIDLVSTALLHSRGLIVEMNPIMRVMLSRGEWVFALVKGLTLVGAWIVMAVYARQNPRFVRRACLAGSAAYVTLWLAWFTVGR